MKNVSIKKIALIGVIFLIPIIAVYLGLGEMLRISNKPSEYIGLTFSILAASLFAVISIVGDPSMLLSGNWRQAWKGAKDIQLRLMRLTYLFVLYLVVLALLVASEIVEYNAMESWYFVHDVLAFVAVFSFLISVWLPFEIKEIQISRLEKEIAARKNRTG
ncbi:MAG: hypothetical protein JKX94_08020 [Sneathiella sp.]|nr:hypothetical protein [Sneathiella sp.]